MSNQKPRQQRNPELTRTKIIDAAHELFIEKGCDGTALSEIAVRAGVTKSLIHHYFGTKENLYMEFLQRYFHKFAGPIAASMAGATTAEDPLSAGFLAYFHYLRDTADYVRTGCWVNLFYQKHPELAVSDRPVPATSDDPKLNVAMDLGRTFVALIRSLQNAGRVRSDMPAESILAAAWCLAEHWHEAKALMGIRMGIDTRDPAADDQQAGNFLKILLEGVVPR